MSAAATGLLAILQFSTNFAALYPWLSILLPCCCCCHLLLEVPVTCMASTVAASAYILQIRLQRLRILCYNLNIFCIYCAPANRLSSPQSKTLHILRCSSQLCYFTLSYCCYLLYTSPHLLIWSLFRYYYCITTSFSFSIFTHGRSFYCSAALWRSKFSTTRLCWANCFKAKQQSACWLTVLVLPP